MGALDPEGRHSLFPEDFIWRPLGNIDFAILPNSIVRMLKVHRITIPSLALNMKPIFQPGQECQGRAFADRPLIGYFANPLTA